MSQGTNSGYSNEMRGVLFKAREKRTDRSPDYTGRCQIDGVEYWLSGWTKDGQNGKYLSLSLTKKDGQNQSSNSRRNSGDDDDFLGGTPGNSQPQNTSGRLTPSQVAEMGRDRKESGKQGGFDNFDDDIPF